MITLDTGALLLIAGIVLVVFGAGEAQSWVRYWRAKRRQR